MTTTPQEPLDEPVDAVEGEDAEEAAEGSGRVEGTDYLDDDVLRGGPGDSRKG